MAKKRHIKYTTSYDADVIAAFGLPAVGRMLANAYARSMVTADEARGHIARGIPHDETGDEGESLLTMAMINQDTGFAAFLLEKGVRVDHQDRFGRTALMIAAAYDHDTDDLTRMAMLVKAGADIDTLTDDRGNTARDYARERPEQPRMAAWLENALAARRTDAATLARQQAEQFSNERRAFVDAAMHMNAQAPVRAVRLKCAAPAAGRQVKP